MNRATRDRFVTGTNQADLTSGTACLETPPLVFAKLAEDFGPFDIDLTADAKRHLCPIWFGPDSPVGEYDVLTAAWSAHGASGYSNPPYGRFVKKLLSIAKFNAQICGFTSVLLLPMRATKAFRLHVLDGASDLLFCDKRLTFFENGVPRLNETQWRKGRTKADPALFDSILVIYRPGQHITRAASWSVPKHVTKDDLERAAVRRRGEPSGRSRWEERDEVIA